MSRSVSTRFVASSGVAAIWLLVLAIAGRPLWLAVLLGLAVVLVWLSPFLLASNRHRLAAPATATAPLAEAPELRPGT
jgi:hypothetical protein